MKAYVTVYVVVGGYEYESCDILKIFKDYEEAKYCAENYAEKSGYDYVEIREHEVEGLYAQD